MGSFCKESNKLVGSSNFLAWKKRIALAFIEYEVMEYVTAKLLNRAKTRLKN